MHPFLRRLSVAGVGAASACAFTAANRARQVLDDDASESPMPIQFENLRARLISASTTVLQALTPVTTATSESVRVAQPYNPPFYEWDSNWDGLGDRAGKGTRRLILVRHGQYESANTDEGRVLTELGRRQAEEAGRRLNLLYKGGAKIDRVVYSTMTRATETANIIKSELKTTCDWEPCTLIREGAVYPPEPPHPTWKPSPKSFVEDGARIAAGFEKYVRRAERGEDKSTTTLFVCHGNVIRYFFMRALQLPPSAWLRIAVANCSITVISIRPNGKVSVETLGDAGFMPTKEMITFN